AACVLGSSTIGSELYLELAQSDFVRKRPGGMHLTDLVHRLMRGVDQTIIREARLNWLIGVTDESGNKAHLDTRSLSERDLWRAIYASKAAPFAFNRQVTINGTRYVDGHITGLSTEV